MFEQAGMIRKPSQKKKKREQAAAVQNRFFPKSNCAERILNVKESLGSGQVPNWRRLQKWTAYSLVSLATDTYSSSKWQFAPTSH